jgi:hypothetical protein
MRDEFLVIELNTGKHGVRPFLRGTADFCPVARN